LRRQQRRKAPPRRIGQLVPAHASWPS
jgi:hypothetical protein